ncbi:T9SS type A sorting domain-containing protein [Rhodocaloribacter sp.]
MNTFLRIPILLMTCAGALASARAQAPDWAVNPADFESTMSVTAMVLHGGDRLGGAGDVLAAFVGDEVRGVAEGTTVGSAPLFFLTVFADTDGETVRFEVYDAAAGTVRPIAETEVFETNAVRGIIAAPLVWTAAESESGLPDWNVDPSAFVAAMNITGTLRIDGAAAEGGDVLAAFVGDEVRGVAEAVDVGSAWLFFLTIYAGGGGETVRFEVYDASANRVYETVETLTFETNALRGTVADPFVWTVNTAATATAVEPLDGAPPGTFRLEANYPNPFNPATRITYALPAAGPVRLTVHDALGREVARLVEGRQAAGRYAVTFEAGELPSGLYLYRLQSGAFVETRTMVLIK